MQYRPATLRVVNIMFTQCKVAAFVIVSMIFHYDMLWY